MKNEIILNLYQYPAEVKNQETGAVVLTRITLDERQLQAAQAEELSPAELIGQLCDRQGFALVKIGEPVKIAFPIDLGDLSQQNEDLREAACVFDSLYEDGADQAGAEGEPTGAEN